MLPMTLSVIMLIMESHDADSIVYFHPKENEMPFCPTCKYEYVEGVSRCPDCDVELVPQLEEKVISEELVCVLETNHRMEATVVADMLNASGIKVLEQPGITFYGRVMDSTQDTSSYLYVFKSQAEEAEKLIAAGRLEYQSAGDEDQFLIEDQPESEYNQK
jgi:hypothetical protein